MFLFSYIVPKDPKLLIFQTVIGKGLRDNPKYLYLYAKKNIPDYKSLFFTSVDEPKEVIINGIKKYDFRFRNWWKILRAEYIFVETDCLPVINLSTLHGRFNKIFTWHGIVSKKIGVHDKFFWKKNFILRFLLRNQYSSYKFSLSTCDYMKKVMTESYGCDSVVTGYPRNDILYDSDFSIENLEKSLSLKKYKKVLLYAPTYRDYSKKTSFTKKGLKKLNALLKKKNYLLLVKSHPLDSLLTNVAESNIKNVTKEIVDIQEVLPFVDILISDYSGVIFDYAHLSRPIILFAYDYDEYVEKRGMYFDMKKRFNPLFFSTEEEIISALAKEDFKKNIACVKQIKKDFHSFHDGLSSKRVFDYLGIK